MQHLCRTLSHNYSVFRYANPTCNLCMLPMHVRSHALRCAPVSFLCRLSLHIIITCNQYVYVCMYVCYDLMALLTGRGLAGCPKGLKVLYLFFFFVFFRTNQNVISAAALLTRRLKCARIGQHTGRHIHTLNPLGRGWRLHYGKASTQAHLAE